MILVTCSVGLIIFQYLVGAFIYYISRILPLYTRNENGLYSIVLSRYEIVSRDCVRCIFACLAKLVYAGLVSGLSYSPSFFRS